MNHSHTTRCPACGKKTYTSRADAKRARRVLYPHDRLNAYRCTHPAPWPAERWHLGHRSPADRDRDRRLRETAT